MRTSERPRGPGFVALGGAAIVVAVDLATKRWAEHQLNTPIELVGGARLSLSHNSGVAFGRLADAPDAVVLAVVAVALTALAWALTRRWLPVNPLGIGVLIGGAVANLVDRSPDGRVTDFIDLPAWPTFNVADIAITLGVLLLLLATIRPPVPASS